MSIQDSADEASILRLWSHTVCVVNTVRTVGTDERTGRRGETEEPGTGVAGLWAGHYFILTAKHVLENARPRDVLVFCRRGGGLKYARPSDITKQDVIPPLSLSDQNSTIHRCEWEDLALVATPKGLGRNTEFFDVANSWVDPAEGETVHCFGTPRSNSVLMDKKKIGTVIRRTITLIPSVFSAEVMGCPSENELKFKITAFDPQRHYLIPYEPAKQGGQPHGISGAATWVEEEHGLVWAPRFKFAGICTVCYKAGTVEQVVKASIVRKFLEEVFGPADEPTKKNT